MNRHFFHSFIIVFCVCFPILALSGCGKASLQASTRTGFYFDTIINVTLYDTDTSHAEATLDQCFDLAETYENMISRTVEGSDIWQINHAAGNPVPVHDETLELLQSALSYAELTNGQIEPYHCHTLRPLELLRKQRCPGPPSYPQTLRFRRHCLMWTIMPSR